jgi:F-box/leucine-rich repeat protein 10/11
MPVRHYDDESIGYGVMDQLQAQPIKESGTHIRQALYASPPAFHADLIEGKDVTSMSVSSKPTASLVSPPTSLADEMDVVQDGEALASVEAEAPNALHTPNSSSRHSSRQPRHGDLPRQSERSAPEATANRVNKPVSISTLTTIRRTTPFATSSKKPSSRPSSSHAKKSSPMVERHFERHAPTSLSPHQLKHAKHFIGEDDTDAESLRLIRELQEEEFGLRRRRG